MYIISLTKYEVYIYVIPQSQIFSIRYIYNSTSAIDSDSWKMYNMISPISSCWLSFNKYDHNKSDEISTREEGVDYRSGC